MNIYEQEVFNYITQLENYRSAKEISNQIGRIDQELIRIFWQDVKDKITDSIVAAGWNIDLSFPNSWLSIHRSEWNHLGINCDQLKGTPDLGIHAPEDIYDRGTVNSILEPLRQSEENGGKPTHGWPYYSRLGFDFSQPATLESILPANKEDTVTKASTTMLRFFNKYAGLLEQIEKEAKKVKHRD